MSDKQILKLKGKTAVFIDWANVYGWYRNQDDSLEPQDLVAYLKSYEKVDSINFYYGTDKTLGSQKFIDSINDIVDCDLVTKPVKYIEIEGTSVLQKKCDFDLEIGLDCFKMLDNYEGFIFFSGDGDFATLYTRLIEENKQVVVIYQKGHLGREVWEIDKGLFKTRINYLL